MEEEPSRWHAVEVKRALRCRGIPLESLRHRITPTNEHYLLLHWEIPETDAASWRLVIGGKNPLRLSIADIRARPAATVTVTLECAGNGRAFVAPRRISNPWHTEAVSTAVWTGVRLMDLLEEAQALDDPTTKELVFSGVDRGIEGDGKVYSYQRSMPVELVRNPDILVAYQMNGQDLPAVHGAPLRLLVPGWYGAASVKWLHKIEPIDYQFEHPKMRIYRDAQTEAELSTAPMVYQSRVRAVILPPGVGSFSRTLPRLAEAGRQLLMGRAWAGGGRWVTKVEVTTDGGESWSAADVEFAELAEPLGSRPVAVINGQEATNGSPSEKQIGAVNGGEGSLDGPVPGERTWVANEITDSLRACSYSWQKWTISWDATVGEHLLGARATDSEGNVQPMEPRFTWFGVGNNCVEMVRVVVVEDVSEGMPKQYM